jgi:hypothetical protein
LVAILSSRSTVENPCSPQLAKMQSRGSPDTESKDTLSALNLFRQLNFSAISIQSSINTLIVKLLTMSIPSTTAKDSPSPPTATYPPFGSPTPYAEPLWYSRNVSPHYNDSHRKLRAAVRKYVDEEIIPYAFEWESAGIVSDSARAPASRKKP